MDIEIPGDPDDCVEYISKMLSEALEDQQRIREGINGESVKAFKTTLQAIMAMQAVSIYLAGFLGRGFD